MGNVKRVYVDCISGGAVIATYEFGLPQSSVGQTIIDQQSLIDEAKSNLSDQALANPPFTGVSFRVRS